MRMRRHRNFFSAKQKTSRTYWHQGLGTWTLVVEGYITHDKHIHKWTLMELGRDIPTGEVPGSNHIMELFLISTLFF